MKIACQTITFGSEKVKMDMHDIVKAVADAGYDGIETGVHRLDMNALEDYKSWLGEYNLKQAGMHVGGNFSDTDAVKQQIENVPEIIKVAHKLDCANIFFSGGPVPDYKIVAENLNKFGKALRYGGVTLSYHNHDWEFKDGGFYILCEYTDPECVSFVPDIGWVTMGGANPVQVLKELGGRVSNLHFKDFTSEGGFTELGKGIVDFKPVYDFVKSRDIWLVAEQDASEIGACESVRQNLKYIKSLA